VSGMPRLSADLAGPRHPERCQSCGAARDLFGEPVPLERWREHNEEDRPLRVLVILCGPCARRLIDPHPRLYAPVDRWAPWPGAMPLCSDCTHREGLQCQHPDLKTNGGPGLELRFPQPSRVHFLMYPRRLSGWHTQYHGPVEFCAGRTPAPEVARPESGPAEAGEGGGEG
jgi:hypothetical protein